MAGRIVYDLRTGLAVVPHRASPDTPRPAMRSDAQRAKLRDLTRCPRCNGRGSYRGRPTFTPEGTIRGAIIMCGGCDSAGHVAPRSAE